MRRSHSSWRLSDVRRAEENGERNGHVVGRRLPATQVAPHLFSRYCNVVCRDEVIGCLSLCELQPWSALFYPCTLSMMRASHGGRMGADARKCRSDCQASWVRALACRLTYRGMDTQSHSPANAGVGRMAATGFRDVSRSSQPMARARQWRVGRATIATTALPFKSGNEKMEFSRIATAYVSDGLATRAARAHCVRFV